MAKADAPDELEFEVQGQKFKLGDVRLFGKEVASQKAKLADEQKRAERVALEANDMLAALKIALDEAQKASAPKNEPAKTSDWTKNPLYEELVPVFQALEKQAKDANEIAVKTKKDLDNAQAVYAAERLRREWAEAGNSRPKEAKFEEVVKEVLMRGDKDSLGLPSLGRWLHDAGEGTRIETAVEEAVKKNNADWEQKMRMSSVSKPGGVSKFSTKKAGEPPIKKLDDLTSEVVANDPDILAAMNGETV